MIWGKGDRFSWALAQGSTTHLVSAGKCMCIFLFYPVLIVGGQLDTLLFESD